METAMQQMAAIEKGCNMQPILISHVGRSLIS